MNGASISADNISYTYLSQEDKRNIEKEVKELLQVLTEKYQNESFFGRMVKGDYIECVVKSSHYAFRIALIIKLFIKSIELISNSNGKGVKYFKEHGVRIAAAVAPLLTIDPENGIIDGEAIYMSGRAIKDFSTSDKQKIIIKKTMFFCSKNMEEQEVFDTIFSLLDNLISRFSAKQSQVIYLKLMGYSEKEIGEQLNKNQSTISQHSTAAGWQSIEKAVNYFEKDR